jgi:tetratricopeptide (TPR) repeat protein
MVYFWMKKKTTNVRKDGALAVCVLVCMLCGLGLYAPGCSPGREAAAKARETLPVTGAAADTTNPAAVQHFIDGAVYEVKGDFARAVLEFQDALRYGKDHAIYHALSSCYSALGKHALAIENGRQAVALAPDKLDYRRSLADVYFAAFQLDSAAVQYEEIVRRDSSSLESWYSLARIYEPRKPLKALEVYEKVLDRFGPEWGVLLQVADLYNKMGKFDKAAIALKSMVGLDPANQALKRSLAQTYLRGGKADEALAVLQELHRLDPENLEYVGDMGGVFLMKKEYAKAAEQFEPIFSRDTVSIDVKLRIGQLYYDQMEKDSTLAPLTKSLFEQIRDRHPQDWRPYWFLGALGSMKHDDSAAVRNFRKVTQLAGWNADGWVYLSGVYLGKNDFGETVQVLEAARKVVPDDFRINFFLGVAYNRLGRNNEAAAVLERARQINPKDLDATAQLAMVYDVLKRYAESDSLYEEALKLEDPKKDLVMNNYAYSLAERGEQLQRALEMATKAVEAQPDNASYLDTKGWVFFRLGRYREAETYITKAITKGEASATLYEHLGDIYYMLNDKARAVEQWNAALKLDANNTALREKVSRGSL